MTKRLSVILGASAACLIQLYVEAWVIASSGLLGEVPFGYHSDFYVVKQATNNLPCVTNRSYSRHEDIFEEDFHFSIRTKSGRLIRLWFNSDQDVSRICSAPKGLLVVNPGIWQDSDQLYNVENIADRLSGQGIQTLSMRDILCDIDELAPLFEANYYNKELPRITHQQQAHTREFRAYLRLEIADEQLEGGWLETPIK